MRVFFSAAISLGLILFGVWIGSLAFSVPTPAIAPPDDLGIRTNEGVDERLRNEAAAGAFLDLFTIGWDVMRTVLEPTTDRETPHDDGDHADEPTGGT